MRLKDVGTLYMYICSTTYVYRIGENVLTDLRYIIGTTPLVNISLSTGVVKCVGKG